MQLVQLLAKRLKCTLLADGKRERWIPGTALSRQQLLVQVSTSQL
jgi:hypothetical protein